MDNMTIDDIGFQQRVLQRMMELTQQKEEHLKQKMEYEGPGYQSRSLGEEFSLTSSFGAMPPVKEHDSGYVPSKARLPSEKILTMEDDSYSLKHFSN